LARAAGRKNAGLARGTTAMPIPSFKSMSIATRLTWGFVSVLVLLAGVAATSNVAMRMVSGQMQQIVEVNNLKIELASSMLNNINQIGLHTRTVALLYDAKQIQEEAAAAEAAGAAYLKAEGELKAALDGSSSTDTERQLLTGIAAQARQAVPALKAVVEKGVASDNVAAVQILTDTAGPIERAWRAKVTEFAVLQKRLIGEATATAAATKRNAMAAEMALVAVALAAGSLIAWRITRGVTRPLGRAVAVAERIAEGDLTSEVRAERDDETGRLLQAIASMQDRLSALVGHIRLAADAIETASSEVASGNQDLSHRTEQAASNLQQTASSMEQLTGTVKQSAEAARQANQLASSAAEVAARGGSVVSDVVTTMDQITHSSKKIADIIGVIDGIAFQTNILALNAAVEAARAGEQGRGFAVVAGEVRSLAGRSAEAAKEIKSLIGASVERVETGSRLVAAAGATMTEIVGSVQRVSDIIAAITASSAEQSEGIGQVNTAVTQLDQMTQQNAALVEEGAAAAESLKEQAQRLAQMVGTFRVHA
jgi:methyl-accepting chemotaxis protein